ncbi:elongator complex protein 3 [Curtanaerobium respiraculi]|uniref:elongator complex protein 3 n=1 Tax=Curtanaerobium respiraculi TaxID=2949669 RepID=UPI0024B3B97E|nr:tRNA uridine(34) 5-carboxymethylaminomethyl modification radical SAM/GNAT enzyme Elp3 [Curtanaerobium respiraculi]
MNELFNDIVAHLHAEGGLEPSALRRILAEHNRRARAGERAFAKKHLYPYFLNVRATDPERWRAWNLSDAEIEAITAAVRMKPRRTQSGVATITVITKPWPCSGQCRYCPSDIRMPKSYLSDEPACQRAERNCFDPYLQVASRLTALTQMGHTTDKLEIIVLGGTFAEYPRGYQVWFARELFRAANDAGGSTGAERALSGDTAALPAQRGAEGGKPHGCGGGTSLLAKSVQARRRFYEEAGIPCDPDELARAGESAQAAIDSGRETYNEAFPALYGSGSAWQRAAAVQTATIEDLEREQTANEGAAHRVVGLVVETRPDTIDPASLTLFRRLGCTKVQIGVQSISQDLLDANLCCIDVGRIAQSFELLRGFGFKTHAHAMVNLMGSEPDRDRREFARFVSEAPWQPDEVKLYPAALIGGTQLERDWMEGRWKPYDEETLVGVLAADVLATPPYTRISRMIRDFSSGDIIAGNRKPNLRQLVEERVAGSGAPVREIRYREIGKAGCRAEDLHLETIPYETTNTDERFLQWTTPEGRIAGFLRLSLPRRRYVAEHGEELPIGEGEAMIREVHVYGSVARLGADAAAPAQHHGLGTQLVEEACRIAREAGYGKLNVISAVGTRGYYRARGFEDNGLYQQRAL